MTRSLRDRLAALEAAGRPSISGEAVLLSDAQLWEVIHTECARVGMTVPDVERLTDREVDLFLVKVAERKNAHKQSSKERP